MTNTLDTPEKVGLFCLGAACLFAVAAEVTQLTGVIDWYHPPLWVKVCVIAEMVIMYIAANTLPQPEKLFCRKERRAA